MRTLFAMLFALLIAVGVAAPASAQDLSQIRVTVDSLEIEGRRALGFIRAAETQLAKVNRLTSKFDSLLAVEGPAPTLDPEPEPEPDPTPDPEPTPAPEPLPGELAHLNWDQGTGNSRQAVTDGGVGVTDWCSWPEVLSVVDGASVGLPEGAGNALAIRSIQNCGHVELRDAFPRPAAGQVWSVSYLFSNGQGQSDSKDHPLTFNPVGSIEMVHLAMHRVRSSGDWNPRAIPETWPAFPFGAVLKDDGGALVYIPAGTWIRYEFELEWVSATQFRWYPRIYDLDGNLLYDEYDWKHTDSNLSVGAWYDASPGNVISRRPDGDVDAIRTIAWGMGQAGNSGRHYYVADVRVGIR